MKKENNCQKFCLSYYTFSLYYHNCLLILQGLRKKTKKPRIIISILYFLYPDR